MAAKKKAEGKQKGTKSSAFGSAGRISHDASTFYESSLYSDQLKEKRAEYFENKLPKATRNQIFAHSSEQMHELPDASVHLMVTSPPYNAGKEYDQNLKLDDYLAMLSRVWAET